MEYGRFISVLKTKEGFRVLKPSLYYSPRYDKFIYIPGGMFSDGATGAKDIKGTDAWVIHDRMCVTGRWSDGSIITTLQESMVLYDVLVRDGFTGRSKLWPGSTFLFRSIKKMVLKCLK